MILEMSSYMNPSPIPPFVFVLGSMYAHPKCLIFGHLCLLYEVLSRLVRLLHCAKSVSDVKEAQLMIPSLQQYLNFLKWTWIHTELLKSGTSNRKKKMCIRLEEEMRILFPFFLERDLEVFHSKNCIIWEAERQRSPLCWFTPQMPPRAGAELCQSRELGTQSKSQT